MPRSFINDLLHNSPNSDMFKGMKTYKEVKSNLKEATASKTQLQYVRAKTARNDHFEARRYIADRLLNDKDLAMAYKSLDMIHSKYSSMIGNDAVQLRARLEKMLKDKLKQKVSNWDKVHSEL
mgnify:CR=1 FL=1